MSLKYRNECPEGCKVFIGNLDRHLTRERIRHVFGEFGRIRDVWLATNPPGFGFVMFDHKTDAKYAVKEMNNEILCGRMLTVELATGVKRINDSETMDERSDRRLSRDSERRRKDSYRSGSGERRTGKRVDWSASNDRYFYSSDYQRKTNSSSRRGRQSGTVESGRRTRSRERREDKTLKDKDDDKSRSRRRTSDH